MVPSRRGVTLGTPSSQAPEGPVEVPRQESADGLRVGLIGAGAISPAHVSALRMITGIQLVAVCDRIAGRASRLAEQFAIPDVFSSADEMLETSGFNVVHVLTPPSVPY